MNNGTTKFLEQLAEHRKRCGLSYRSLEQVTGIKYSALAAMQSGNRPVGEQSARRLAEAFGLSGETQETFVLTALNTSRERVLQAVKEFPAEVLNALGLLLLACGIEPAQIVGGEISSSLPQDRSRLRLSLADGRQLRLDIRLTFSP